MSTLTELERQHAWAMGQVAELRLVISTIKGNGKGMAALRARLEYRLEYANRGLERARLACVEARREAGEV